MNRTRFRAIVMLIALVFAAAPALPRAVDAAERKIEGTVYKVAVLNDHEFAIGGKTYPMEQFAKRLKSDGAKTDSEIRVQIPQEMPMPTLKKLTATLIAAGCNRPQSGWR